MKAADLAVLGLIVEQPRHGYEIEKVIESRNMREWTDIGFSSIYAILSRLEAEGFVRSRLRTSTSKGPPRKQYAVTEDGRKAWQAASLRRLGSDETGQLEFLLGLTALPALPQADAVAALESHELHLQSRFERVSARLAELGPKPPLFLVGVFEYSLRLLSAELDWTRRFARQLAEKGPTAPTEAA